MADTRAPGAHRRDPAFRRAYPLRPEAEGDTLTGGRMSEGFVVPLILVLVAAALLGIHKITR